MKSPSWHSLAFALCVQPLTVAAADFPLPATNPRAEIHQQVASTRFEINYGRPSVRGREIFGALVPFGRIWRTGADAATSLTASTAFSFGGVAVEAGSYELFTIPGPYRWEVILQSSRSQWGSYAYDPARDVARIVVTPSELPLPIESFTIGFDDVGRDRALLYLAWARTRLEVPVTVDLATTVVPRLEEALAGDGRKPYFHAAMFYFESGLDLARAAELMEKALESTPGHIGMLYRLALIREGLGDIEAAVDAAERSLAGAATEGDELRDEYTRLNSALLERLRAAG